MYGSSFQYKSETQKEALIQILNGVPQLIVSLPTGGGKSLLFIVPAKLKGSGTTVVIVPLLALKNDLLERLKKFEITARGFDSERTDHAQILIATPEQARTKAFLEHLTKLSSNNELDRIVIDECHAVVQEASFRPSFTKLYELRRLKCQFICLSATLPEDVLLPVMNDLLLENSMVIVNTSIPINVFYNVEYSSPKLGIYEALMGANRRVILKGNLQKLKVKTLIFVNSVADGNYLAQILESPFIHSNSSNEEKNSSLNHFGDTNSEWLITTSFLEMGVDFSDIACVFHYDMPKTFSSWIQQMGRGGRNVEHCECLL
ncbi:P-loop containing nucleoside triphosphate hydrolase protein, partial [Ascobolus immersus RN42]